MSPGLSEIVAGITKGSLEWGTEQVRAFAEALTSKQIAFIGSGATVREAKAVSSDPEFRQYKRYITDTPLRTLARLGLLLRRWQDDPLRKRDLTNLRNKIHEKYGDVGLHITQVVQTGILDEVVRETRETSDGTAATTEALEIFLKGSEKFCLFVQGSHAPGSVGTGLINRLRRDAPAISVLFARGTQARRVVAEVVKTIIVNEPRYNVRSREIGGSLIVILIRKDAFD